MKKMYVRRLLQVSTCAAAMVAGQWSWGALLLNYQFETVTGSVPTQTTVDSSGTFNAPSNPTPAINALLGYGATPTAPTSYPQQTLGPVANGSVQSLNPNNYMAFNSTTGSTNYTQVQIEDASSGALDATFTNFSVALWLNPTSNTRDRFAIGKMGASGQRGWQISGLNGTNDLSVDYFDTAGSTTDQALTLSNVLPLNTWTHVAVTFDGAAGVADVYINGVLALNQTTGVLPTWNAANTMAFKVGHRGATGSTVAGWIGGIDDVRIYNETLTASQVQSLVTVVPEPTSIVLGGLALIGGFVIRRRCR